jgi:glycosyltransferase involved in cell wall biosynthesis
MTAGHTHGGIDRVVIFSDVSWPLGGAEGLSILSVRLMAEAGLPVSFIAGDDGARCPLDTSAFEFIPLGGAPLLERPLLDRGWNGVYDARMRDRLAAIVARVDTPRTVYHLHNWSQIFSPAIFDALAPVTDRLFMSAHDYAIACPNQSYSNYQRGGEICPLKPLSLACIATHCDRRAYSHKLWRVARQWALHRAIDFSTTRALIGIIHPFMTEFYVRAGIAADRIRVLRNPVNPFSAERIPAERNQDVFFIGRVVHEKGVDLAAEAARLAGRRLQVIGDGPMRAELEARYPEAIFHGFKNHGEISALLQAARAVLVPSRLPETFTLVAHEAMRAGVPVIAFNDVDGVEAAEIGAAIVVPPREASALAEGLKRLDDDAATEAMSQLAFTQGARFSNTAQTWRDALIGYYLELLDGAPPTTA